MNPTELKELARTLVGIADGRQWQIRHDTATDWREAECQDPLHYIGIGTWQIRLKPWELGRTVNSHTLPEGAEWHRQDFTEDMLPAGTRPLMLGEKTGDDVELYSEINEKWIKEHFVTCSVGAMRDWSHHRTTRPIPFTLTQKQIADGWVLWNGGECPVEPESQPTVMLRDGTIIPVRSSASRMDWKLEAKPDGGDIIAYRPDPYGHLRQALADGEVIQYLPTPDDEWFDIRDPKWEDDPSCYRIKEPQWVPLGPEDVPPFSVIRRKGQTDEYDNLQYWHWRLISYVTGIGPVCADRGYNWQELSTDYEINRPRHRDTDGNPTLWEPCRKQSNS